MRNRSLESRMRENRTYGSEGGEPSNGTLPYPYLDKIDYHIFDRRIRFCQICRPHGTPADFGYCGLSEMPSLFY